MGRWEAGGKHGQPVGGKQKGYDYRGNATQWCYLCGVVHDRHEPTHEEKRARLASDGNTPSRRAHKPGRFTKGYVAS